MNLISIYERADRYAVLYRLLGERTPAESISHKRMPTFQEHKAFVDSKPYEGWYLIIAQHDTPVGTCYLTKQNEIGIFVFRDHRGKNYGKNAVRELRAIHGSRRYLANINPQNSASVGLFKGLGFKEIQRTFELIQP